ncbi:hypothetical protein E4T47_08249 [Aureobasidium subglaciale]|nr:hypothetical protein E4T47_08249 [Aureobasidium subglaciale]
MKTAPSTSDNRNSSLRTASSTWSRNSRYTLRLPLIGRQIHASSRRPCRQVETALYMPSTLYRSFHEFEREICSAIFGALYEKGETTSFAMYAEMELLYHVQDGQSGYLSPKRERVTLNDENWEDVLELVLSGSAKKAELRAVWHRSKGSAQLSKSMSPSNFPAHKNTDLPGPIRSGSSVSPRRSETMSTRRSSSGSGRDTSPVSRADSGLGQMAVLSK